MDISVCDSCKSILNNTYYMIADWELNDMTREALKLGKPIVMTKRCLCSVCYSMWQSYWELEWKSIASLLARANEAIIEPKKRNKKK